MGERSGRAKEVLGWATGDREVEAEGRVEEAVSDPSDPITEVTDDAVETKQDHVRRDYEEFDPSDPPPE